MLDMIKLTTRSDALPHELSGGTQQKTAVARALAARATLLLLDEPLGALDLKVRAELRHELRRIVKDLRLTALHVTHDQAEAMSISDRIIVMKKGRIIESGKPVELYLKPKNIFTANFVGEANFLTGAVTEILEDGSLVEIGKGLALNIKNKGIEKGERIVIAFRPEFASIIKYEDKMKSNKRQNSFSGSVVDLLYSGSAVRFRVRLETDDRITVKKQIGSEKPEISIGEKVQIQISKEHLLIYPYPDEGLYKAQALE
jgi:ABC-type Fe3+/spermidine/putrescine transport system ATPase subunit